MLEGTKKSSEGYWTESVVSEEITEEDFLKTREVAFEREPTVRKEEPKKRVKKVLVVEPPEEKIPEKKTRKLKMANLEDFFESAEPAPENKKRKKRVWPGGAFFANAFYGVPHPPWIIVKSSTAHHRLQTIVVPQKKESSTEALLPNGLHDRQLTTKLKPKVLL